MTPRLRHLCRFAIAIGIFLAWLSPISLSAATPQPDTTLVVGALKADIYRGTGTPMIFIPSLGAGPWIWEGLDQHYAPTHPVYTLTLAGFDGRPPTSAPAIDKIEDDLARLITQQHLQHAIVVGHSLGGFIALRFAETHPDLVGSVVAVEGFPVFPPLADKDPATRRKAAEKLASGFADAPTPQAFHASMLAFLQARMNDPAKADHFATLASRSDPKAVGEYILEMLPSDLRPDLVKLKAPLLAIAATDSYRKGASEADIRAFYTTMFANAAHAHIVVVPNARHFVMVDQREAVASAIDAFLGENDKTSDATAIRDMLMKRFDRPDARLVVDPLVIEGDAAIADWVQGDHGGRALLQRQQGQWSLVLCGGDGLTQADVLIQAGVAPEQAHALADHLALAERQIAPATLARLKQFPGIVHMGSQ